MLKLQTVERTLPMDGQERPTAQPTRPVTPPVNNASHAGTRPPRVFTLSIEAARSDVELLAAGTAIWLMRSTNAGDELQVKYDGQGDAVPLRVGNFITGISFNRLTLTNSAVTGASVVLVIFNELHGLPVRVR